MAKLTKKQKIELDRLVQTVERLERFIMSDRIAICVDAEINSKVPVGPMEYRNGRVTRSQEYTGTNDTKWTIDFERYLTPIDKGIGSDLVALYNVKKGINRFIENNT